MFILSTSIFVQLLSSCQPPQCQEAGLQKTGRYFVCLRRGHISRECHSRAKCPKCGGKHHVSICSKGSNSSCSSNVQMSNSSLILSSQGDQPVPTTTSSHSVSTSTPRSTLNVGAPTFNSQASHQTTLLWVSSDRAILLQTAQATVFNMETPQKSQQIRIFFDCGSQHSYVTERLTEELSLTTWKEQSLTIMTFGSS